MKQLDEAYNTIENYIMACVTNEQLFESKELIRKFGELYLKYMKNNEFNHDKAADRYLPALQMAFRLRAAQIKVGGG
jgi:hypothetical protein